MHIVRIKTLDEVATGVGTKITNQDGAEIHGVVSAVVTINCNKVNAAKLELQVHCGLEAVAEAEFVMLDPASSEFKTIKRIEFADGTFFEA